MSTWSDRPLLFGHRGARGRCPENTIIAFMAAIADGANALELDVHVTKDGVVVVLHDDTGERMCGVPHAVKDTTYEQLKTWDAGARFDGVDDHGKGFAGRGLRVPTLEEVLRAVPGVPVNIDLKPADPACVSFVVDVVRRMNAHDRVLLTSFHDATLDAARAQFDGLIGAARGDTLLLRWAPLALLRRRRLRVNRLQVPPQWKGLRLDTPELLDKWHSLGLAVDYWVINDVEQARALLAAGADGLMSDVPRDVVRATR